MKYYLFMVAIMGCLLGCLEGASAQETNTASVVAYNGKPCPKGMTQVYAHRAGRGLLPEQTKPAYVMALRLGVDYVDMDVNLSKDGVLMITHDLTLNPNLTRRPDGQWIVDPKPIYEMNAADIETYDVGRLKPGTDYAAFFPDQLAVDGTHIPTLKEIVEYVKAVAGDKVGFQIEIKNDPTNPELSATPKEYARALYKLLQEEKIINRTEVQAFDWSCLLELKNLNSEIKCAFLSDHATDKQDRGLWTAGLKPKDYGGSFPKMVKKLGGDCWEPFEGDLTQAELEEAHKLGIKVVVWGWPEVEGKEFDLKTVTKLIGWGVDGIITDRPDILLGLLGARGQNLPARFVIDDDAVSLANSNE